MSKLLSTGDISFAGVNSVPVEDITVICSTTEIPFSRGLDNFIGLPLFAVVRVKVSGFFAADFKVVMVVFVVVVRGAGAYYKIKKHISNSCNNYLLFMYFIQNCYVVSTEQQN